MAVHSVEAIALAHPEPNDRGATQYLCLARVTDTEGVCGWGETWTRTPEATIATIGLIDALGALLVGRDALETTTLWRELQARSYWYGEGGLALMAISALDIALWDLKCRLLDVPLMAYLGGPARAQVPVIACSHPPDNADLDAIVSEVQGWMERGFKGYKFGMIPGSETALGISHERDTQFVGKLREALGPDSQIMVDVRAAFDWDLSTALRRVSAFEEHGIRWIEEPFGPSDIRAYQLLRDSTRTLVAFGEREWTATGYDRILSSGSVDVVGVDLGRVGGITGARQIIGRIEAHSRHFNAHTWSGAILSAASLALTCSTDASLVFEAKPLPSPMLEDLGGNHFFGTDGYIEPLSGPGLGIEVDEAVVQRFRLDR